MIDRYDLTIPTQLFQLVDDRLHRVRADGSLRPCHTMHQGRLVAIVGHTRHLAAEVAWALHYGVWPEFPLFLADGNPENLAKANLLPMRNFRPRLRITQQHGLFFHPLEPQGFPYRQAAEKDWHARVAAQLAEDLPYALQLQAQQLQAYLAAHGGVKIGARPVAQRPTRSGKPVPTSRPSPLPGKRWHWYEGAWLAVPAPVHPSDDYKVRCHAVKYENAVAFCYDEAAQVTKARPAPETRP